MPSRSETERGEEVPNQTSSFIVISNKKRIVESMGAVLAPSVTWLIDSLSSWRTVLSVFSWGESPIARAHRHAVFNPRSLSTNSAGDLLE